MQARNQETTQPINVLADPVEDRPQTPEEMEAELKRLRPGTTTVKETRSGGKIERYEEENGYWDERELDSHGCLLGMRTSNGFWCTNEYDDRCLMIHYKNSTGYEEWFTYNEDMSVATHRNNEGFEWINPANQKTVPEAAPVNIK